ncbi:hypothetical protein J2Y45_004290 [Dyadobacter sp. BE34]|uniref:DUF4834 domain-containing protein n=1 Tax=Dyadobacter fermentans TaxID=94254 RepID=A0ABU1R1T9_9BACT|nr:MULTISPECIES: DUF4834 family protein [Dyadobacter]MDR6807376.1 hypothetical protein [Dyadobacter fermentans]MDR7045117.1 hypothetical protein [Dyadobacter sp. BE242]MDR7199147.1 hypothetical protein [Dyadobacter sp. BE34]MDR7217107.1 hypothetical protein [Dyadobacter sp. BE31]MDR7265040.1 hypothetical protein [Dyadobacter sp. BE32]
MKVLFNILFIFLLLIAFVPFFRRFLFHLLVGRQLIKQQEKAYRAQQQAERARTKPGGIRVDSAPQSNSESSRFKGGEYVDYEEVK